MISLKPYVGKIVMLQLKQPFKMSIVVKGHLMPLALVFEPNQPPRLATDHDPEDVVRPMATDLLIGEIKEAAGRYVLTVPEPGDSKGQGRLELDLSEDLILGVTYAPPTPSVVLIGG